MKKTWKWFYLRDVGSCSAAAAWTAVACDWPRRIPCANWKQWTRWTGKTTGGVNEPWKSIFKKGGGGFLQKEKKKGFISLGIKTKFESRKEKIELGRELKINRLNCYLIKQTDYSHLTESRVCLITSLKSDQLEILPVVRFFDYSETRTVHSAYVLR